MKNRKINLVASLIVATALFADRAAVSAPVLRPQLVEQTAARVMDRLTLRVRRVVPVADIYEVRQYAIARVPAHAGEPVTVEPAHRPSLPYLFRLPPPTGLMTSSIV